MWTNECVKDLKLTMNCSRHMIPYLKTNSMDFIYKLVTVAILMTTKYGRRKTIYILAYSMFNICDIDIS